jgi:hypothetical protein
LQLQRTEIAARRIQIANLELKDAIFNADDPMADRFDLTSRQVMTLSMQGFVSARGFIEDLKVLLIRNDSPRLFVTSDDPGIMVNRYHVQRLGDASYGVINSGALLFMPLTPRWYVVGYDKGVYTVPENRGWYVQTTSEDDIGALNELQYLRAAQNLYFSNWTDGETIGAEFEQAKARRPASWSRAEVLVSVQKNDTGELFREANESERLTAPRSMVRLVSEYPTPSRWFSKLKFRSSPRTYTNGTAIGHVRKPEWLDPATRDRIRQQIVRQANAYNTVE